MKSAYYRRADYTPKHLTKRCLEVLGMLTYGLTDKEIASALRISEKTVQYFRLKIKSTLNLETQGDLIRVGIAFNLCPL